MMLHRKDFENHNFSFKVHCKPIYSVCYACSGPEGIIHYSKSTEPPKIQEIAKMPTHMVWQCVTRYLTFTHGLTAAKLLHTVIKKPLGQVPGMPYVYHKVEHDKRYLPYIKLGNWLCSHFQLETPLNFLRW